MESKVDTTPPPVERWSSAVNIVEEQTTVLTLLIAADQDPLELLTGSKEKPDLDNSLKFKTCTMPGCPTEFGVAKHRHHCRFCGHVYCHKHSSSSLMSKAWGTPQRICEQCLFKLKATLDSQSDQAARPALRRQHSKDGAQHPALLIIDVQNDFCPPNGALKIDGGTDIIPVINKLRKDFTWDMIVCTLDWHPKDHVSFYANHKDDPKAKMFEPYDLKNGTTQVLWPMHCVQHSDGAKLHPDLVTDKHDVLVYKGANSQVDSYSGFFDNDRKSKTELEDILQKANITQVFVVGLATDYCVGCSALDARTAGFSTYVVEDACRGVSEESIALMKAKLKSEGVKVIPSKDVGQWMREDQENLVRPMIQLPKELRDRRMENEVVSLEQMLESEPVKETVHLSDMLNEGPTTKGGILSPGASPPASPKTLQQVVHEQQKDIKEQQRLLALQKQQSGSSSNLLAGAAGNNSPGAALPVRAAIAVYTALNDSAVKSAGNSSPKKGGGSPKASTPKAATAPAKQPDTTPKPAVTPVAKT